MFYKVVYQHVQGAGGMLNIRLTENLLRNLPMKKFSKSVKTWQNYGHESVAPVFLAHPVDSDEHGPHVTLSVFFLL